VQIDMQFDDQGLVNTDPRFIAVPDGYINLIPTDVRGLTFNRSPQMVRVQHLARRVSAAVCITPAGLLQRPYLPLVRMQHVIAAEQLLSKHKETSAFQRQTSGSSESSPGTGHLQQPRGLRPLPGPRPEQA